ncbi:MAG: glycosyltransferase [Gloeocapsa sp. DLM2.Bin57]|nr:MAG: glycosyltransferase [Gloeocapsa sp. DLM2.Bin57]
MSQPEIAAIICTHNRDNYLGGAIDSLLEQDYSNYEIIVIDNASSDRTPEVVRSRLDNPKLKYIYEPELGLSIARNRGAKETDAEIIAYLDDDAIASPQWLREIVTAYRDNPQLAIAGGKVTLIFPEGINKPNWLSDNLAGGLGAYNLGDKPIEINNPNLTPRGVNYSIRRSCLEQLGGFDINLGRIGKKLLSNEELYMTEKAIKKGWSVMYLPQAIVAHNVAPERLKPDWFLRRSWWQGVSEYYREEANLQQGMSQLTRGGERLVRGLSKSILDPQESFAHLVYAYGQIGYLSLVMQNLVKPRQR